MRGVDQVVVGSIAERTEQGVVGIVEQGDGKTGGEARYTGEAPVVGKDGGTAAEAIEGKGDGVAGNQVVFEVPCGDGAALAGIDWIELLAKARAGCSAVWFGARCSWSWR